MKSDQVLFVIAILAILFYFSSSQKFSMYGGAKKEACCGMNKMY
jgi:ABC-type cobalt transport system substrate-binding protein